MKFGCGSAWLCVIGLGLVTSCVADIDGQPAKLTMDQVPDGAIPTGSVCNNPDGKRCFAHVQAVADGVQPGAIVGHVQTAAEPAGFAPADLQSAYDIPVAIGGHPLIALIDAYGYTALESDLAIYRSQFGLPSCTTQNGCLTIVNQDGETSPLPGPPPRGRRLDARDRARRRHGERRMPSCYLLVVQADDDIGDGLELAQATAASLDAAVISNSWGGPEKTGMIARGEETYFDQPVAVFVAAGDDGYDDGGQGPDYPGTSAHTIAVGGTHLVRDASTRGWSETAWASGGSACQPLDRQAGVSDRHDVQLQGDDRHRGGRRSADRHGVVRLEERRLGHRRRHERRHADHRRDLRGHGQRRSDVGLVHHAERRQAPRRHERQQRLVRQRPVHGRQRMGRPDRLRHAGREAVRQQPAE